MTQSGELITHKGETTTGTFGLNGTASIHYSDDATSFNGVKEALNSAFGTRKLQMIFLLKGDLYGYMPGCKKACIKLTAQQHNILWINENLRLQVKPEAHNLILISIDPSFLSRYVPEDHIGFRNLTRGTEQAEPAVFSDHNLYVTSEISAILNALKTSTHTGFCQKLFLESKILELLVLQLSQFEQFKNYVPTRELKQDELDKMYEVKNILTSDMHEQFSLRSLAHMIGTNEFNLKRNFKLAFGTTVFGYLNEYKMTRAKRLLIEKDITIAEVSEKMGYKYATHFSNAFKKYFGYLPNKIKSGKLSLLLFIEDASVIFEELGMLIGLG